MRKSVTVPHTAIIYTNQQDRNRLIETYLEPTRAGWNSMTVLSCHPDADSRAFRNMIQRRALGRGRVPLSVIDVREYLARGRNAAESILSHVRQERPPGSKTSPPLIIGDWTNQVYGNFQTALAVEKAEERMSNLICCYKAEGFWSLNTRHIARTFELHQQVLFGSTLFRGN